MAVFVRPGMRMAQAERRPDMNFWDSLLVAGKILGLLLDVGFCAVFVLLALAAISVLFSILPREESRPCGRLLAAAILFWNTRSAVSMFYIPGIAFWLWLVVPVAAAFSWWRHSRIQEGRETAAFDHTLGAWILLWGCLWVLSQGISLFLQGAVTAWITVPLGVLGGWIVGRVMARLWTMGGATAPSGPDPRGVK